MDRGAWRATFLGSERVGQDRATFTFTFIAILVSVKWYLVGYLYYFFFNLNFPLSCLSPDIPVLEQTSIFPPAPTIFLLSHTFVLRTVLGLQKIEQIVQRDKELLGFLGGGSIKSLPVNAGNIGDVDSVPGFGRSPGGGDGNPL